jgi:hypothetical protein
VPKLWRCRCFAPRATFAGTTATEDADNADKKNCAKPGKFADEVKAQPVYADNQDTMIAGKAVKGYGQCWLHVVVLAAADIGCSY